MSILTDDWNRDGWSSIIPEPYPDDPNSLEEVEEVVSHMYDFYELGLTRDTDFRVWMLRRLKTYLKSHEDEIFSALYADLGKVPFESYETELGLVYKEINYCIMHSYRWSQSRLRRTQLAHFPSLSCIFPQPMGVVLIMSPWNYPLQLTLIPLIDAICAGNCVALKPSRTSTETGRFIAKLCYELFDPHFVFCFHGSDEMNDWLLQVRFDKLFFTGSPRVGRKVMHAAADNLCSVTLELGGKSPCFIDRSANLVRAAQRIAWGKCLNAGQTCVAPDYFLVHEDVLIDFLAYLEYYLHKYYGKDILACDDYPHIINRRHFDRICGLIDSCNPDARIIFGGGRDESTLKIEPTAIYGVKMDDPVMKEEIFGPVFPIIPYRSLAEAFEITEGLGYPLSCYIFADDPEIQRRIVSELPYGGGCINDVVSHIANNHLPFGGFGESGIGSYHGKAGFDCFTHYKSVLKKSTLVELPIRTPPFDGKLPLLRMFMH